MGKDKSRTPLILIAEDNEVMMRACIRSLKPMIEAAGGDLWTEQDDPRTLLSHAHAMQEYARVMLITDGDMPFMQGPQLISELAGRLGPKLAKRVLLSGNLDATKLEDIKDLNVASFQKPVEMNILKELIRLFLSNP